MKTVRIIGTAQNARELPHTADGVEVWTCNGTSALKLRCPQALLLWTRWFNLHSHKHMTKSYPSAYHYLQTQANGRPIYLQKCQEDMPASLAFPREQVQARFATAKGPNRYFSCSVCWEIAFAIMEGFERIELWGFELRDTKPDSAFEFERPCFAYWVQQARDAGVEVWYQAKIQQLYDAGLMTPGDPDDYTRPLYGYSTKPEPDWDMAKEQWIP